MPSFFPNLASRESSEDIVRETDRQVAQELSLADIKLDRLFSLQPNSEVMTSIQGKLGDFKFVRAWTYWMVTGPMPIETAKEIFVSEHSGDIRAGGHCGRVAPEQVSRCLTPDGLDICIDPDGEIESDYKKLKLEPKNVVFVKSLEDTPGYSEVVFGYHIDSQEGLSAFAEFARKLYEKGSQSDHGWLPMDSAPKDGTKILMGAKDIDSEPPFIFSAFWGDTNPLGTSCGKPRSFGWCVDCSEDSEWGTMQVIVRPLGWMPIPSIPERWKV